MLDERDQPQEQGRDQQDVHHVQPRDDELAGELTGKDEELGPGSDRQDRADQTVDES